MLIKQIHRGAGGRGELVGGGRGELVGGGGAIGQMVIQQAFTLLDILFLYSSIVFVERKKQYVGDEN